MNCKLIALCVVSMFAGLVEAQPQVVSDSACEKYAVDIAAFATCENGRVTRAAPLPVARSDPAWVQPLVDDAGYPMPPAPAALPRDPQSLTLAGHYLTAQD
ncbi:MAG: hypothetical protein JNJ55_13925, partial [Betaproteobacteria bacterium]|nr:hypothetical protein [Betaproteobacteria bacterium]